MPAERGIFLDVLPRFDMAAMGAILSSVEGMFKKSGAAIGDSFGDAAQAKIAATAEAQRKASNVTADAELRQQRAIHATEIAEQQREVAVQRTLLSKARLLELQASEEASTNSITAAAIRYNAAKTAEARATYAAADAKSADIARTRDLAVATGLSNDAIDKHNATVAASATTLTNWGRVANVAGLAAVGGFALVAADSTKMAADFQQSMVKLQASAGETGTMTSGNLKVVSDGILQLAGQVGVSANQLADSMFLVEKAGYQGADGIKVLTAAAQLANAEGADLNETVGGLTTTMRDFNIPVDQAATMASKMNVAVGMSKAPLQDFSGALHNVEPVASLAKISIDDLYAAMARLTQSGAGADQASQWLNNFISHLMNANAQQQQAIGQLGLSYKGLQKDLGDPAIGMKGVIDEINDAIRSKLDPAGQVVLDTMKKNVDATASLKTMYEALPPEAKKLADQIQNGTLSAKQFSDLRLDKTIQPAITAWDTMYNKVSGYNDQLKKGQGTVQSISAEYAAVTGSNSGLNVFSLLSGTKEQSDAYDAAIKTIKTTTAEADGTVKGFNETQETLNKKLADARASFGAAAIQLGNAFLPAITKVATGLASVAQYLVQHKALLDDLVGALGLVAGAWVTLKTVSVVSGIVSGLSGLVTKLGAVRVAATEAGTAMAAMGTKAAEGEAGVVAATAGEDVAIGGVATATEGVAGAATVAIGAFAALAVAAGAWMQWGNDKLKDLPTNAENARGHGAGAIAERGLRGSGPTVASWTGITEHGGGNGAHGGAGDKLRAALAQDAKTNAAAADGAGTPDPGTPDSVTSPSLAGGADGSSAAAGAPAIGTQNNPIYTDPQSITDGLNASDIGSQGTVGGTLMSIFTDAGSGGFTLANIAKLLTTFTVNLALGNPAGKLATGQFGDGDSGGDLTSSISDVENMTPTERIEKENTLKMQKAIRTYQNALRDYAKALQKYGPGSSQALDAEDSVLNARDAIDQTSIDQQQAGGTATQAYADDVAKGVDKTNPGKFAKDKAAAGAYQGGPAGSSPAVPGAPGYTSDAALLAGVPKGGTYSAVGDLSKGLGDCSSAVEDLVNMMDGRPTAGRSMSTGNEGQWLSQHGFMPGEGGPGDFRVGYNGEHTQATLPGGTNFNYGSQGEAQAGGVAPNSGADDPAFTQHYYRPVVTTNGGGGGGGLYDPSNTGTGLTNPAPAVSSSTTNGGGGGDGGWGMNALPSIIPGSAGEGFLGLRMGPQAPAPGLDTPGPFPSLGGSTNGAVPGSIGGIPIPSSVTPGVGRSAGVRGPQVGARPPGSTNGVSGGVGGSTPPGGVGQSATAGVQTSQPKGGTGPGAGASGGGLLGAAVGAGAMAANIAPGAGLAAQIAAEEGERAAKFAGQAAGIAVQGLQETFTLHSPDGGADGSGGGWIGKIAGGLAGAHPSQPNAAGALKPKDPKDSDKSKAAPALKPGDAPPGGPKQGDPNSPGPGNTGPQVNIQTQNVNHGDGQSQNNDLIRQMTAMPMAN